MKVRVCTGWFCTILVAAAVCREPFHVSQFPGIYSLHNASAALFFLREKKQTVQGFSEAIGNFKVIVKPA